MPVIALKETSEEITPILQNLYQQSLDTHDILKDWKQANIVPNYQSLRKAT
ncbi:hypothetical protein DPMN_176871 [Dreissena polymorpha]|uniref:Uncharacterized protein n=1 Tax=Dreissena polymorpha TaxID=45954 RepID=A0A9D4EAP2_DREPO|nr:hypothetical protein DPMN_176255 [Dreissena polymorpha]KAH3775469.1 hypothetical protein DPMN_176871 [Dreissena polymorpha]